MVAESKLLCSVCDGEEDMLAVGKRLRASDASCSPLAASSSVSGLGSPPAADTRIRALLGLGAKTMVSSGSQVAPRLRASVQIFIGVPPVNCILRISVAVTKPIHSPSGRGMDGRARWFPYRPG